MKPVIVGITGASGAVLALRTVDELLYRKVPTNVVCSNAAVLRSKRYIGVAPRPVL